MITKAVYCHHHFSTYKNSYPLYLQPPTISSRGYRHILTYLTIHICITKLLSFHTIFLTAIRPLHLWYFMILWQYNKLYSVELTVCALYMHLQVRSTCVACTHVVHFCALPIFGIYMPSNIPNCMVIAYSKVWLRITLVVVYIIFPVTKHLPTPLIQTTDDFVPVCTVHPSKPNTPSVFSHYFVFHTA